MVDRESSALIFDLVSGESCLLQKRYYIDTSPLCASIGKSSDPTCCGRERAEPTSVEGIHNLLGQWLRLACVDNGLAPDSKTCIRIRTYKVARYTLSRDGARAVTTPGGESRVPVFRTIQ